MKKYSHYQHEDVLDQFLISSILSLDINFSEIDHSTEESITFSSSSLSSLILSWFELKGFVVDINFVNVYSHKRYYAYLYKNSSDFENRFDQFNPNKTIKPNGFEIKALKKTNQKECLYHNKDQVVFASFKFILNNKNLFNLS